MSINLNNFFENLFQHFEKQKKKLSNSQIKYSLLTIKVYLIINFSFSKYASSYFFNNIFLLVRFKF